MDRKDIWTTELGEHIPVADMTLSHLHSAMTFLENQLRDVIEKLSWLNEPLPAGARLTEEAVIEVYMLKCRRIQLVRWQGILQAEVGRRQQVMNAGFSKILSQPFTNTADSELPALLKRQAD